MKNGGKECVAFVMASMAQSLASRALRWSRHVGLTHPLQKGKQFEPHTVSIIRATFGHLSSFYCKSPSAFQFVVVPRHKKVAVALLHQLTWLRSASSVAFPVSTDVTLCIIHWGMFSWQDRNASGWCRRGWDEIWTEQPERLWSCWLNYFRHSPLSKTGTIIIFFFTLRLLLQKCTNQ